MNNKYLGIEIGGTKFQAIVTDSKFKIIDRIVDVVGKEKNAGILQNKIESSIKKLILKHAIKSIGVGFGGPVDIQSGSIFTSYQVSGWNNFNLIKWLNGLFNVPVYLDNDANLAALAEARMGCGKKHRRVFYITLGSGVGGGFIVDGEVYHGKSLCESEFGHICINKTGDTIESSCSGWALNRKLFEYIHNEPDGVLAGLVTSKGVDPSKCLLEAIAKGDKKAKTIFDEMIDNLTFGLSHVVHLLNPEIIVIGGGLSLIGEYISNSVSQKLPQYLMSSLKNSLPEIEIARLKEDVVPLGAVLLSNKDLV